MALRPDTSRDCLHAGGLGGFMPDSDIHNNSLLFLSLTQSRQAWTTALFRRYAPDVSQSSVDETSTANGDDIAPKDPELVGSCTVVIGPHMFPDTRFFRFPYRSAQRTVTKQADNVKGAKNDGDDIIMHETIESTHVSYQLAFEFRENPTDRWLLPEDAVIEALSMSAPYEVIATFRLPSLHGDVATKSTGQHITMHFSEVSEELWQAIRAASGDQEQAIQRLVKDIQVNLDDAFGPIRMPFEQPLTLTERVESDDRISLYGGLNGNGSINPAKINLAPKKRASDCTPPVPDSHRKTKKHRATGASPKKAKKAAASAHGGEASLANTATTHEANSTTTPGSNGTKKCLYCGCKSTPMWRRGPQGAGTLCNACGVKWKHGKILQGVTSTPNASGNNTGNNGQQAGTRSASSSPATADDSDRKNSISKTSHTTTAATAMHTPNAHHGTSFSNNETRSPLAPLQREISSSKSSSSPEGEMTKKAVTTSGAHTSPIFVPAPLKKRFSVPGKDR